MEAHRVHRLMCYKLEPKAIMNMSYNEKTDLLAVLRSDNRIEIWNMETAPFIQATILLKPQTKLRSLAWCKRRLFGADLDGSVKEIDTISLKEKKSYPVTSGGPCHCLAVNRANTLLAVGTELGYINIFKIKQNGLSFDKITQTESKRVLSICWDASSQYIITSGVNHIRLFNYEDGSLIYNMKPVQPSNSKKLCVWCITITDDFIILAGDSSGRLTIWDARNGVCIDSFKSHMESILTICLSKDQKKVYCAGVDPDIKVYDKTVMKDETVKWIKSKDIINHTHDVNALVYLNNGKLCSGGVDSYLSLATTSPFSVKLFPPILQNPSVYVAQECRNVLLRYPTYLEVWHLNSISVVNVQPFSKLLEIHSNKNELICCCDLSNDGNWIAYSTNTIFRVFKFSFVEDKPVLQIVSDVSTLDGVCHICFSPNSKRLITADSSSTIQVFSISPSSVSLSYDINVSSNNVHVKWKSDKITLIATSYDGKYIAIAGTNGQICVFNDSQFHTSLPKYNLPATAISFHPTENTLYAVYSDYLFIEFSLDLKHYTSFSRSFNSSLLNKYFGYHKLPVTNISFDYDKRNVITLHSSSVICVFDKNKVVSVRHENKRMKRDPDFKNYDQLAFIKENLSKKNKYRPKTHYSHFHNLKSYFEKSCTISNHDLADDEGFHVYEKFQHLVYFGSLASKEMIAVEIQPARFLENLPPLLKKKSFGKM
ncbi:UTP4 small subunit processome component l(3)72Dn [Lycorma delicatula]|uniref:UTP4 small subunit processome component l(3)72Dn n=1 Tax=Lycorma delicatula TaxID=130591 RepID=UPI003F5109C7